MIPSVQHFLKSFLHSILIRDFPKHIDKTYLQQSKALKVHCVNKFIHVWFENSHRGKGILAISRVHYNGRFVVELNCVERSWPFQYQKVRLFYGII